MNTRVAVGTTALGFVVAGGVSFATITGAFGLAAVIAAILLLITDFHTGAAASPIQRIHS